jgi:aminopeptidase 2
MDVYISKPGFPFITVAEHEGTIHLVQDRFLQKGIASDTDTIWNVPLNLLTVNSEGNPRIDKVIMKDRSSSYSVDTKQPFKLNAGTFGYYRVLYSADRFRKIAIDAAKPDSVFEARDRLGLVQDAFAFAGAQIMNLSVALDLLTIFKDLREYYLWSSISTAIETLVGVWWENKAVVDLLNELRKYLFKPIVSELGYVYSADEHPDVSLLRTCAISNASQAKDEDVVNELRKRFKHFQETKDSSLIPEELEGPIYATAVEYGGEQEYLAVQHILENPSTPTQQLAAITAMCGTSDRKLVTSTIEYMTTKAREQDVPHFISGLMKNPAMKRQYVEHFKENYDMIYEKFKDGFLIGAIIKRTFAPLTTNRDYEDTKAFFKDGKDTSRYALSVSQVLDCIQENMVYIESSTDDLLLWLEQWKKIGK